MTSPLVEFFKDTRVVGNVAFGHQAKVVISSVHVEYFVVFTKKEESAPLVLFLGDDERANRQKRAVICIGIQSRIATVEGIEIELGEG